MTTAHRPTWHTALGGSEQGGNRNVVPTRAFSAKDLPGYQTLKSRPTKKQETLESFRETLRKKENKTLETSSSLNESAFDIPSTNLDKPSEKPAGKPEFAVNPVAEDADDQEFMESSEENGGFPENSDSGDDDSSSEDDELLLKQEVERIRREKEEEERRKEEEKFKAMTTEEQLEKLSANPALASNLAGDYSLKKRWYEDTVFKNQAKFHPDEKKRFVNDTVRSDFHRKFLAKYILT